MISKILKKNAGVFILFLSIMLLVPNLTAINLQYERNNMNIIPDETTDVGDLDITKIIDNMRYVPIEDVSFAGEQNDIGYNIDAGDTIYRALDIYVGEPVNERVPGNGRTGTLEPSDGDGEDWYRFTVCAGQNIQASVSSSQGFNSVIHDADGQPVGSSFTATETGRHYFRVYTEGQNDGDYTMSISISGQNDAETGSDAGDNIGSATSISPGSYFGYMDSQDVEDWYSFNVGNNQGIFVTVDPMEKSDYDIHLYNPSGTLVHSSKFYGTDELEYPADVPGTWTIKLDIFPGWDASIWPDDYFLYGSGAYELEITVGGDAEAPPTLTAQREVVPVAQTFVVNDDPTSTSDEYSYLAAVPAAVYMENGDRHVSPIVYQGVDIIPNWFTTIDQATQYLLDDWNAYLDRHGMTADVIELDDNPIKAAADIATTKWTSSNTAVIAIDGSGFTDETNEILNKNVNLNCQKEVTNYQPDELQEGGEDSYQIPLLIGAKYAAVHLFAEGEFNGDTFIMTPRYESIGGDWWPYESGSPGIDKDSFFPVSKPGLWVPQVSSIDGLDQLKVVKYTGDRHKLSVTDSDTSLKVTITTEEDSHLVIFLIDPEGNIRRPRLPHWNGGEIKPIYQWNGGHWEHDEDQYRHWIVEPHKEFTVEVNYPMKGTWTAIVVPYIDINTWEASFDGTYHITATIRKHNPDRVSAGLSAANAAVLASQKHVPLLYVTEDSVPTETSNAITQLGVTNIFFVNINDVSSASPTGSVTEYTTLKDIVSAIKANTDSENVITITSFATGDGYFAPSAMIAASHGSPVLSIGEAKDAYNTNDMFIAFLDWDGDYYHGCRSIGDIPMMDEPINIKNPPKLLDLILYYLTHEKTLPPVGLDLRLQWGSAIYNDIHSMINNYGLDNAGQEAYIFVSPRDTDIRDSINRILLGNNSYSGQIMVETTAFSATVIARNVLYPAIIYANPGRDVVSSQHMNYYAGRFEHDANDGISYLVDAPIFNKNSYSSWGRFYEGHTLWENLLERYNTGSSLNFYSGHGTGGSGISAQYKNMAEQFPLGTTTHESLYDFEWWDSWAGYSGYDNSKTITVRDRDNSLYNSEEPGLYNFIHFKWVDQLFENLHSEIDIWSSCTTAAHFGPIVYLSHGTVVYAGCTGSGYTLVDDFYKSLILRDFLIKGWTLGEAFSLNNWIVNRDYTTLDPTSIYGEGTFFADGIHSVNVIFGDPTIQCYNPTWIEPVPISS
ncbi:MAG: hypothetical protein JSV67_02215 [Thermoplasmatales archaeon]|nr:MAG: hypothetical protein JSV67_02215 [Thermoplasmatales archaeon]